MHLEPAERRAARGKRRRDAPHEGGGRAALLRARGEVPERNLHGRIALREHADRAAARQADIRGRFEVDGRGEDAAVLVVGVVAAELHAAGCGKVKDLLHGISLRIVWHQYSAPRGGNPPPPRRMGLVSAGELC